MGNWIVDQAHSTVGFEVKHMMISKVRGQFDSFIAEVEAMDVMDLTTATISFKFDANSINTRSRERDQHLKSADFFDVENYPTIEFQSTNIRKSESGFLVTGNLTIKEIMKSVTFDVMFGGRATDPSGVEVFGYEAETIINREQFGLIWNAALETGGVLVGKEIRIFIELELHQPEEVASSAPSRKTQSIKKEQPVEKETTNAEFYEMIAENATDLVMITNESGDIQYISPSLKIVLHEDLSALQKANFYETIHPGDLATVQDEILSHRSRTIKKPFQSGFRLLRANGDDLAVEATITSISNRNEKEFLLIVMRDISEQKETEKAIYQLAFHDSLTNLPNRRSFMNQLRSEVMERNFSESMMSVFFIDLDHFKQINDQWGHDTGDMVLKIAAKRIRSVLRPTDLAARFGGDEFVVLLKDIEKEEDTITIASKILNQFQHPITITGQEHKLSCSIGVAHYPHHGDSTEELIKNADTALYYVKERGKGDIRVFDHLMEHQSLERRILENALRQGIKEQQFFLEYQPKFNIATNKLIGMEALVRWNHPELGVIPPGKFISLAEETGLIVPLGEWILKESCQQTAQWQKKGFPPLRVSVNVSVRQLEDIHFVEKVKAILDETKLDPQRLELEITESVLADVKSTVSILKDIRNLGIHISIDDFGTGYSSLNYIKELPIDTLKIDRSFVKDIHTNKESKEIAKAILNLAYSIGLNVVAEGVELKEHVDELSQDELILGQGYFYSRPLRGRAFEQYMTTIYEV